MKNKKISLSKQLISITSLSLFIMIISIIIVLPKSLEPFFEQTVYSYLEKPLDMFEFENSKDKKYQDIAYIQYLGDDTYISNNYKKILKVDDYTKLLKYITSKRGKFKYKGNTYYYSVSGMNNYDKKIAITTSSYIELIKQRLFIIMLPIVLITFTIILILLLLWSKFLVNRIQRLKIKIDNMNDENFSISESKFEINDELKLLDDTIDKMKEIILSEDKYKREMYQNISHDFKTPIMVIKSYIEAYNDGTYDDKTVIKVSKEQIEKLENKVKKLLELNKITYLRSSYKNDKKINITKHINDLVQNYKIINKDLDYIIKSDKKEIMYNGTEEIWEAIVNNLLNNFIRYAKKDIAITIKENKIIFYNDGEKIDESIINNIFDPYKKGSNGQNGIGLSIVKGNLDLLGYKINIQNKKSGVEFIISKK